VPVRNTKPRSRSSSRGRQLAVIRVNTTHKRHSLSGEELPIRKAETPTQDLSAKNDDKVNAHSLASHAEAHSKTTVGSKRHGEVIGVASNNSYLEAPSAIQATSGAEHQPTARGILAEPPTRLSSNIHREAITEEIPMSRAPIETSKMPSSANLSGVHQKLSAVSKQSLHA
jgi:hypothetical protein